MLVNQYGVVSFQINTKTISRKISKGCEKFWKVNCKKLLDQHDYFYLRPHLHQVWFVLNVARKVVDVTTIKVLRTARAMLRNFCIFNIPRCQILISGCKVFCLFRQIFVCEKVKT